MAITTKMIEVASDYPERMESALAYYKKSRLEYRALYYESSRECDALRGRLNRIAIEAEGGK